MEQRHTLDHNLREEIKELKKQLHQVAQYDFDASYYSERSSPLKGNNFLSFFIQNKN